MPTDVPKISDTVHAQLVECVPEPMVIVPLPDPPTAQSPTQQAHEATIQQVGAEPPPVN